MNVTGLVHGYDGNGHDVEAIPVAAIAAVMQAPFMAKAIEDIWPRINKDAMAEVIAERIVQVVSGSRYGNEDGWAERAGLYKAADEYAMANKSQIMEQVRKLIDERIGKIAEKLAERSIEKALSELETLVYVAWKKKEPT